MIIHKSYSKTDLVDVINNLNLKIVHSHQDNKKSIQDKIIALLSSKDIKAKIEIADNFYNIKVKQDLIDYLQRPNDKKSLTIKQKNELMLICKSIIQYCNNNFDINATNYNSIKEIEDDMDYLKQFGDIPSVRRCCRLLSDDKQIKNKFIPLISPKVQKQLNERQSKKIIYSNKLTIRYSTPENPIILTFD